MQAIDFIVTAIVNENDKAKAELIASDFISEIFFTGYDMANKNENINNILLKMKQ